MSEKDRRARELTALIARAERQLRELNVVPEEDTYEDGAVIRVRFEAPGKELTYVLLKIVEDDTAQLALWYHTGVRLKTFGGWGNEPLRGWDELMRWVLAGTWRVVAWDELTVKEETT